MQLTTETVLAQIDALIAEADAGMVRSERGRPWFRAGTESDATAMRTRLDSAIERLSPPGSVYVEKARELRSQGGYDAAFVGDLSGILRALRADYQAGHLESVESLVRAGVFADFLAMAEELVSKGYKDAAAVICGSVLEQHLRKLAVRNGVETATENGKPMKAHALNAELGKSTYTLLEQQSVTAWLALRNDAAHGDYDNYDGERVRALIRDVRSFMERYST